MDVTMALNLLALRQGDYLSEPDKSHEHLKSESRGQRQKKKKKKFKKYMREI